PEYAFQGQTLSTKQDSFGSTWMYPAGLGRKRLKTSPSVAIFVCGKMLTNKSLLLLLSALFLAVLPSTAFADSGHNTYQYLVGVDPLCSLAPSACPDIVGAPNGDTVAVAGQGTFDIRSMVATVSGTFVYG